RRGLGNQSGPGRGADLVVDDPDRFLLPRKPRNREQEVAPARTVNPAGAKRKVRNTRRRQRQLALEFAPPVRVERIWLVIFAIWLGLAAVEHIVGRIVNYRGPTGL